MNRKIYKDELFGRNLEIQFNPFAHRANSSCIVTFGETSVLCIIAVSKEKSSASYLPLTVEYREKLQASGKIKGSRWIKREGRPLDHEILMSRLIDRAIRPMLPGNMRNDVQVTVTPISSDKTNETEFPAFMSVIIAMKLAGFDIPTQSLSIVGINKTEELKQQISVSSGKNFGSKLDFSSLNPANLEFVVHPTLQEKPDLLGYLSVAGYGEKITMLEGDADELPVELAKKICEKCLEANRTVIETTDRAVDEADLEIKQLQLCYSEESTVNSELYSKLLPGFTKIASISDHTERESALSKLAKSTSAEFSEEYEKSASDDLMNLIEQFDIEVYYKKFIRKQLIEDGVRIGGRRFDEIRDIEVDSALLKRVHGSGYFRRGETEALSVVTLGSPGDVQLYEHMESEGERRFFHFYNFPPYSVGEARPVRGVSRREIGHGALAEKAVKSVVPPKEIFPYTIQIVTEIMTSNGSSSMASTCGSSIALMSAGVPIRNCVSGVAIGLMVDDDENPAVYRVLTDIQGEEDMFGYMDFKLTCTNNGMTALQMDTKLKGVPVNVIYEAFDAGLVGSLSIRDKILEALPEPLESLSEYAPRILTIKINPEKIKVVIGKGGETIQKIVADTDAKIDIEQDGTVFITSDDAQMSEKARDLILELVYEPEVGDIFGGKVTRVESFGAIVSCGAFDGLLHVSKVLPGKFVKNIHDYLKVGDVVRVKISEVDGEGRVRFERVDVPAESGGSEKA